MSETMGEKTRRRRGAALEEAILDATWEELAAFGYESLTLEAIARRAGTSRPVLSRRWDNLSKLASAAIARHAVQNPIEVADLGGVREELLMLLRLVAQRSSPKLVRLIYEMRKDLEAAFSSFADIRAQVGGSGYPTQIILDRAIARGEVDPKSVVYMPGFDLPHALGEISGSAGARFFTDWDRGGINATFGVTKVVAGDLEGVVADVSLSYRYTVTPQLTLIPVIATTWSNRDYNKSYFGVAATQAATSSISAFSLGSGFKDVSIRLTANYELTDRVSLTASATMSKLLGDAKDSPIVFDDTQTFGFIGLSYRFGG